MNEKSYFTCQNILSNITNINSNTMFQSPKEENTKNYFNFKNINSNTMFQSPKEENTKNYFKNEYQLKENIENSFENTELNNRFQKVLEKTYQIINTNQELKKKAENYTKKRQSNDTIQNNNNNSIEFAMKINCKKNENNEINENKDRNNRFFLKKNFEIPKNRVFSNNELITPIEKNKKNKKYCSSSKNKEISLIKKKEIDFLFDKAMKKTKELCIRAENSHYKENTENSNNTVSNFSPKNKLYFCEKNDFLLENSDKKREKSSSQQKKACSLKNQQIKFRKENSKKFEGNYDNNGERCGLGKLKYKKTEKLLYEGDFQNNLYNGRGLLYNIELDDFRDFKDFNKLNKNWVKYEGDFKKGEKNGFGILFFHNNFKFFGNFLNDMTNGDGIVYDMTSSKIAEHGIWKDNMFVH